MNDFFSMIGSIASLVSLPLAIYLYLKSREAKFDKLKKEIARVLSYQIGDERQLTTFEIKTVISSKLRENRINSDLISVSEIIEDLVSETISSPLISKDRKTEILENMRKIYLKGELFDKIETITEDEKVTWENIEPEFKNLIEHRQNLENRLEELKERTAKYKQRISTVFAMTAFIVTTITMLITIVGKDKFVEWNNTLNDPFKEYEFAITVVMGAVTSILAGFMTYLIRKKSKK